MLIGHLPVGYLTAKVVALKFPSRLLFAGVLAGSVLPDLDMMWFFLVDQSTHHHHLITHRPIIWLGLLVLGFGLRFPLVIGAGLGGLVHMVLDTTLGQIAWGWPLSEAFTTLIHVEATHDHWLKSFAAHWTFKVEVALVALALFVLWRSWRTP